MQTIYQKMETTELDAAIEALKAEVAEVKAKGLALDMARGKPGGHLSTHARYPQCRCRSA